MGGVDASPFRTIDGSPLACPFGGRGGWGAIKPRGFIPPRWLGGSKSQSWIPPGVGSVSDRQRLCKRINVTPQGHPSAGAADASGLPFCTWRESRSPHPGGRRGKVGKVSVKQTSDIMAPLARSYWNGFGPRWPGMFAALRGAKKWLGFALPPRRQSYIQVLVLVVINGF